jgi:predicted nucleic acid-binding protein
MGQIEDMSNTLLVDTDVLIDFLRGYNKAISFIEKFSSQILLSPIVVAELYAGVKGPNELAVLDDFISHFRVIPITFEIAKIGGLYKRDFGKSHGVGLADALLAATAKDENAALKTLNVKHYPMIRGLKPAYKKGKLLS